MIAITTNNLIAAIAVLTALVAASEGAVAAGAKIDARPLPACYARSETFLLKANGTDVPVSRFSNQYEYAVFSIADGPCRIEVARLDGKAIRKHSISPQKLSLKAATSKSSLSFAVAGPQYLIVAIDDLRKLVIAIDPVEQDRPRSSGRGIYNVTAAPYAADRTGARPATEAIGRAVDDAARDAEKKGIVYVPAGVFNLSELRLASDVSLYLEAGAVLRLSGKREDFKLRYKKNSQNRHGTWFIHTGDGATNVRIFGRGTIDGDGKRIEKELDLTSHIVVPMNCDGFVMDGVVLRDSGLWGTVVANSRNVTLRNTKHFNHLDMGENDCVDICNSQDVLVQRSIGISLDDPYSTKTWGPHIDIAKQWTGNHQANRNIVFDDCLSWTRCFAFKIGAGVWQDQENITIRNCVVYDSAHAIGISHSYGSKDVRDVTFDTIDVERNTMTNLGRSWARIVIDKRKADGGEGGSVRNVRVANVKVRDAGTDPVPMVGLSEDKRIENVTFERIGMPGRAGFATTLAQFGVAEQQFARGVAVKNQQEGAASASAAAAGGQEQGEAVESRSAADADPQVQPNSRQNPSKLSERAR